jgi:exodeoxyribonuclease V alpha subunit
MDIINQLKKSGKFAAIDCHFADFIFRMTDYADPVLALSAALVTRNTREGDVCVDLNKFAGRVDDSSDSLEADLQYPDIQTWRTSLQLSAVVGEPGDFAPLILDQKNRLYLHRYWAYENQLAQAILLRINSENESIDLTTLTHDLNHIFPEPQDGDVNWQKVAAAVAVIKRFCVISGGPGTGKTYAVGRILALLIKQAQPDSLRIALTAPTGKAAARLIDSVRAVKEGLKVDTDILGSIPENSSTIHRLLKPIKDTPFFHYNADNPLPFDVVIVDEASMVDLPLMSKLMQALSKDARIILMGDRHQLASVQAGSILGDICGYKEDNGYSHGFTTTLSTMVAISEKQLQSTKSVASDIHDNLIYFTHNYRFGAQGGISRLSEAVNVGNTDGVIDILKSGQYPEITWYPLEALPDQQALLDQQIQTHYGRLASIADSIDGLDALNRFRILCAVNRGLLGVDGINKQAMQTLQNRSQPESVESLQEWYHGRPILITANNYELDLFNGDVGIAIKAQEDNNRLQVYFAEGKFEDIRSFTPGRLQHYQSAYAMTIHKSQGSEFEQILIVLPELDNPLLTRELLYTGITRAKRNLSILATESVIRSAVSRRIERASGLRDALWG